MLLFACEEARGNIARLGPFYIFHFLIVLTVAAILWVIIIQNNFE
jgi:hypothetical protein